MLNLPLKMKNALDAGSFSPVGLVSLTTDILDVPLANQTFTDVNSNLDTASVTAKKNVKQKYPDPSATGTLVNKGVGSNFWNVNIWLGTDNIWREATGPGPYTLGYQTFSVGESIQQANRLKSLTAIITKQIPAIGRQSRVLGGQAINTDTYWDVKGRLYRLDGGTLRGLNNEEGSGIASIGLDSVTTFGLETVSTDTSLAFVFDVDLLQGVKYALLIYMTLSGLSSLVVADAGHPRIAWEGKGKKQDDGDWSLSWPAQVRGGELSLKANFATYDSSPTPLLRVSFDLGEVPENNGEWNILDAAANIMNPLTDPPSFQATSISYAAWAGDSLGAKTISLGTIDPSDAATLVISTLKRYYVLEATFTATTNGLRTHQFIKANIVFPKVGGDFSTHPLSFSDGSFIQKAPTIPTKLDIANGITKRGSISVSIMDIDGRLNRKMLSSHLLNLSLDYRVGNSDSASKSDMILLFSGKITDYSYQEGLITLKAEDRTVNLSQKIPRTDRTQINRTEPRRTFSNKKFTDALKSILRDEVLIPPRFLDLASIDTAGAALPTPARWITHRVLKEEVEADKLAKELVKLLGIFLVVREDGILTAIRYPRLASSVATWDADTLSAKDTQPMGLRKTIINQCFTLYDLDMDGKNSGIGGFVDLDAQDEWAPGAEVFVSDRVIKTEWIGNERTYFGLFIAKTISKRVVDVHKNGMITYKGETGIDQYAVQVGDYVDITSPAFWKKGELGMTAKQFMVINKLADFDKGTIAWTMIEVINVEDPPTASFTTTPIEGSPTLSVTVNASASTANSGTISAYEWDEDYDGVNFQIDSTGVTPADFTYDSSATGFKTIALRVRNSFGGEDIFLTKIRVFASPEAIITYIISAPDQPLFVTLKSGSQGLTSEIVLVEWDLSYDGVTFNPDVSGESTTLSLQWNEITVALRVTDADGQTNIATQTFVGSAFSPASVSGFFVDQTADRIVFNWEVNAEPDIFAYEVRKGSTWNNSILIASEILANTLMTVAPLKAGTHTYLVKAINTSGRYSITVTSITMIIIDPRNRNVVATADRKAQGWPGTKTGLVYEAGADQWWIGSTDDLVSDATELVSAATGVLGLRGTRVSGTFEGDPVDLGAIIEGNRLSIDVESDIIPDPEGTTVVVEFSESDNGADYSDFAQISTGDLGFRFVKEKITLKNDDGSSNVSLKGNVLTIDVPDVFDSQEDLDISASGTTTVSFERTFNSTPSIPRPTVNITLQNMTNAQFAKITNITTSGFDITIHRVSTGTQEAGNIDYLAKGF